MDKAKVLNIKAATETQHAMKNVEQKKTVLLGTLTDEYKKGTYMGG